jgi:hypothetical protein
MKRAIVFLLALSAGAQTPALDKLLDRIVEREQNFITSMRKLSPIVETYIQESSAMPDGEFLPVKDHYFLGRVKLGDSLAYTSLVERTDPPPKQGSKLNALRFGLGGSKAQPVTFLPRGFAQMAFIDLTDFNRRTYRFDYVQREFLGDVRCLVFDVAPVTPKEPGRFIGRIWVEDRDDSIVRINGVYIQAPVAKGATPERYFHFDGWRVNVAPGEWVPSQIYIQEAGESEKVPNALPRFKAQTRLWGYAIKASSKLDELTNILIDQEAGAQDKATSRDASPLESQRAWEKQAEDNTLARLEKGGLLAPKGDVDQVLDTVVNNLIVSANLNVDAHCRVLVTTPVETFSIGHTIVISRGLIDVLPDETSLALVLADELSHIALAHSTQTQFAFFDRTMLSDAEVLEKFRFERSPQEMEEAGKKTIEIMKKSPYQKTANAGVFLKSLSAHGPALPRLLAPNLGNQLADHGALMRLSEFAAKAPPLEENKLEQIAALPLGSRIKLNPWNNQIVLVKAEPISLLSAREKMPFEVTPFALHLTRVQ